MKIDGEGVPRRGDRELPEYPPHLAAVISSHGEQHGSTFRPWSYDPVAIGEGERDRLGQILWRDAAKVIEIPLSKDVTAARSVPKVGVSSVLSEV